MSVILIEMDRPNEWQVWLGLDGDTEPPGGFSFIVGMGKTKDEAVADAVQDLEATVDALQNPRVCLDCGLNPALSVEAGGCRCPGE